MTAETRNVSTWRGFDALFFLSSVWRIRKWGVALIAMAVAIAITYLHLATYHYTATLTVVPADQSASQMQSGLAGLGSIVGLDLSLQQGNSFALYSEAVNSLAVSEALADDPDIMRAAFPEAWDMRSGRWRQPDSALRTFARSAKRLIGAPVLAWQPPSARDLNRYIRDRVEVVEDKRKPVIRVSFEHKDSAFARRFLDALHMRVDAFLRRQSLTQTTSYIDYLENRLRQVTVSEYRAALAQTLSGYEKTRMFASANAPFAADRLGGVLVSPEPTSPKPLAVLSLAALAGIALWFLVAWVAALRQESN